MSSVNQPTVQYMTETTTTTTTTTINYGKEVSVNKIVRLMRNILIQTNIFNEEYTRDMFINQLKELHDYYYTLSLTAIYERVKVCEDIIAICEHILIRLINIEQTELLYKNTKISQILFTIRYILNEKIRLYKSGDYPHIISPLAKSKSTPTDSQILTTDSKKYVDEEDSLYNSMELGVIDQ